MAGKKNAAAGGDFLAAAAALLDGIPLEIIELGRKVIVRPLSEAAVKPVRAASNIPVEGGKPGETKFDDVAFQNGMIAACVFDEAGAPIIPPEKVAGLQDAMPAAIYQRLLNAVYKANGYNADAEKN